MRPVNFKTKLISLMLVILLGAITLAACSSSGLEASTEQVVPASNATTAPATAAQGSIPANNPNSGASSTPAGQTGQPSTTTAAANGATGAASNTPGATDTAPSATAAPASPSTAATTTGGAPVNSGSPAAGSGTDNQPTSAIQSYRGDGSREDEGRGRGGGNNIVQIVNKQDGQMLVRGRTQLNKIWGPNVTPLNMAEAQASCKDCQTFAVALQINLISTKATNISPKNVATALNYKCTRCLTVAVAVQYTFQVEDPTEVPSRINKLLKDMEKEINSLEAKKGVTVTEAINRINAVVADFNDLAANLNKRQQESSQDDDPNVTPLPTQTPEPSVTPGSATPTTASNASPPQNQSVTPTVSPAGTTTPGSATTAQTGPVSAPASTTAPPATSSNSVAPTPTPAL